MDENHYYKTNDFNPQKDFIIETPQVIEEIIYIKNSKYSNNVIDDENSFVNVKNKNNINNNLSDLKNIKVRRYEKGKFLGKGGFAKCYEMKCCESKRFFAAKIFEKKALINPRSRKKLINEIKVHKRLKHKNIVNFEHFFEDKENVYILLELCTHQTLNEFLKRRKRLTDLETLYYSKQIILSLLYIHNLNIIHRDLKLGNLFINDNLTVKLGDFGLAAKIKFPGQKRQTICGTPNYIAPEILEKKNGHSFEVDIWSLGIVIYTFLVGKPPFETPDVKTTYKKIRMINYSFPDYIKIETKAKSLIESILVLDPIKRPSLNEILLSEYFLTFEYLPENMPLATLALPPTKCFIEKFLKKEKIRRNCLINLNHNFNNRFNKFELNIIEDSNEDEINLENSINVKYSKIENENNCFQNKNNEIDQNQIKKIEKGILPFSNEFENNIENTDWFSTNMQMNNSKINYSQYNNNFEGFIDKNLFLRKVKNKFNTINKSGNIVNYENYFCNSESNSKKILNNKIHNINNCNQNKNDYNLKFQNKKEHIDIINLHIDKIKKDFQNLNLNKEIINNFNKEDNVKQDIINNLKNTNNNFNVAGNIINNNFFINFGDFEDLKSKMEENFIKKIQENCEYIIKKEEKNKDKNEYIKEINKNKIDYQINKFTKIKKILEFGNFTSSCYFNGKNDKKIQNKISFYVFNISNYFLGIFFSDYTNLIKNFFINNEKINEYFYIDNQTGNSLKFDDSMMDDFLKLKVGFSENLFKKFEIMQQYNKIYENFFLDKIINSKNLHKFDIDLIIGTLYIKNIIKNDNMILLKLSNKIIQIFFIDDSKLSLTTDGEEVLYKNKKTNENIFDTLSNILNSKNEHLINKIKHAKVLLSKILTANTK